MNCRVLERWRIRHIDVHRGASQCFSQAFARRVLTPESGDAATASRPQIEAAVLQRRAPVVTAGGSAAEAKQAVHHAVVEARHPPEDALFAICSSASIKRRSGKS
jgi:hypothetical protein